MKVGNAGRIGGDEMSKKLSIGEQMVWAATFAAKYKESPAFAAEYAYVAVERVREALPLAVEGWGEYHTNTAMLRDILCDEP